MPFGIAFALGELENLDGVLIGVLKVESFDAARVFVPIRQPLRTGGGVLDFILSQNRVGVVHVADDDGDVLKPDVVALGINGNGTALGSQKLQKLNGFTSQLQGYNSNARTEYSEKVFDVVSCNFRV